MYFCVNWRNLLMKTNGERVLWKFYKTRERHKHEKDTIKILFVAFGRIPILNPLMKIWKHVELPTWRTFIKDKRQSWSALWWSLWKTSGCRSSRIASTLLKNVMWFCWRNSCMFRCMRPCRRPAIMGRCLEGQKKQKRISNQLKHKSIVVDNLQAHARKNCIIV